ncbi:MAG TPA: hypothetical protein VFL93_12360 [Longimicrobiaceae bacterium]|nr:hypothetical protein [Longimicrobiaceae bacterium]
MSYVTSTFGIATSTPTAAECASSELVRDFLYYTGDLSLESAAMIAGVSTATLTRWRMMGARQLRSDVRSRLVEYVAQRDGDGSEKQAA